MQMFLWNVSPPTKFLTVNSPADIAGGYFAIENGFVPGKVSLPKTPTPGITTDLVLYDDGTPDNSDGCTAAVNADALNGKIVVLRRGGCSFAIKVKSAQTAGAIAAIVVNNQPGEILMGGGDATITIPAISVTKEVGEALIAKMALETVNATLQNPSMFVNTDGDFDNGVVAHEYGHGISNRLTGGRLNSNCLMSSEQMGEGWSDFFALLISWKATDNRVTGRGIGTFVFGQPSNGVGIRTYKYSTDMTVNPFTFGKTNNMILTDANGVETVNVHAVGSVWCTMLNDLSWAYVDKYGYDADLYNGTGGNNKVIRLVVDALKLQPCQPSFVQGRDAIIAADQATTGGQNYCLIWEVFARRGLGFKASSGTNVGAAGIKDQVEDFTMPPAGPNCTLAVNYIENSDMIKVFPNPSNGQVNIHINQYVGKVNLQVVDINGRVVYAAKNDTFNVDKTIDLRSLQAGIYVLKISGEALNYTQKIILE